MSFVSPHNPWCPPAEYADPYKRMKLPEVRAREGELQDKPVDHTRTRYNYTRQVPDQLDQASPGRKKELIHNMRAGHYGALSFVDKQIGKVLEALERSGQAEDTIVIFSSDHGAELGDHHNIHKGLFYERSARVPFIVWNPSRFESKKLSGYAGHSDFFPTILSLAGISASDELSGKLEGKDLTPMLTGETNAVQDQTFIETRHGTGLVNENWKISVYPRDGEGELYDRSEDPDELYNLFEDTEYQSVKNDLLDQLVAFHPPLAGQIKEMKPFAAGFEERSAYSLEAGEHLPSKSAPFQQEKTVRLNARVNPTKDGPILSAHIWNVHGYALYLKDRRLGLGLRRYREDTVIMSPQKLPQRTVDVEAIIRPEGELELRVDDNPVSAGQAEGGIPRQAGRERVLAPDLFAGHCPRWANPMGAYDPKATLDDTQILNLSVSVHG